MTPAEFLKNNALSYNDYRNIRGTYGHVGSFAYWPEGFSLKNAEPLLVDSEEAFNAQLRGHLQKGVVILGANYGVRAYTPANDVHDDQKLSVANRAQKLTDYYDLSNQYTGEHAQRAFSKEFATHNGETSVLSGAYMTDLFKFNEDEDGQWLATGLATKSTTELKAYIEEHPETVALNIEGLRHELHDVLGAGEQIVIVLLGGTVQHYKKQIQEVFPKALLLNYTHYSAYQFTAAEFQEKAAKLNEEVLAGIAKW
jgi:hypothetical protein